MKASIIENIYNPSFQSSPSPAAKSGFYFCMNLSLDLHWMRKALRLSLNEMAVLCEIYSLSNNTKFNGWCIKSKQKIAESLDLSKQSVHDICNTLIIKEYILKDDQTKYLQPTDFIRAIAQESDRFHFILQANGFQIASAKMQSVIEEMVSSKESLPHESISDEVVKKVYHDSKESLPKYNISNTIREKEIYKEKIVEKAKLFYKTEVDLNNGHQHIEGYKQLANFLFLKNPFGKPIVEILALENQLPFSDYLKLLSKNEYNVLGILDMLANMANSPKYVKGKKSLFLTLNNWVNRHKKN